MPSFPEALPAARTPPSEAAPALRWGVLGTGWIADRFLRSLRRQRLAFTEPRTAHDALHFEAAEAARRIAEGRLESPVRPLTESIATLQVMDEIRRQIGVTFPGES
jgi:hypothetical protein